MPIATNATEQGLSRIPSRMQGTLLEPSERGCFTGLQLWRHFDV
jgi:hypothetical protein